MRLLRSSAFVFLGTTACVPVQVSSPGGTSSGGTVITSTSGTVAEDVIRLTNDQRVRNGLPAFFTSPRLMEAARIQAEQMAKYQRLDHNISEAPYPTLESRLQAVGYIYSSAAENVAWNQPSAEAAVSSWMSSAGHRANILDPGLREIGVAVAKSSSGQPYWAQVFGTPR